ncbi:MAG TPA: hypothetical protein V6C46_06300 [Coleofasciculaceae cyanobacterium]
MKPSFEAVIKKTSKGYQGQLVWPEVKVTSHPHYFESELEAKEWLVVTINQYQVFNSSFAK